MTILPDKLLASGATTRYHTIRDPGRVKQSVAEHSWGVAVLIATYHPSPSANLLSAALTHDLAESRFGDIPAPTKREYPGIGDLIDKLEDEWLYSMGIVGNRMITEKEREWLKAADIYEGWQYCVYRSRDNEDYFICASRFYDYAQKLKGEGKWPKELHI